MGTRHGRDEAVRVLSRALDQTGDILARIRPDQRDLPTPCREWTLGRLVDHVVATPGTFLMMLNGEQPDWSAPPAEVADCWTVRFRSAADDLIHRWHQLEGADPPVDPDWQTAEFAVHTWDLATAIGRGTRDLDPEVAGHGLAFMRANLTPDIRGAAFAAEQPAPPGAEPYERLAAFSGRPVDRCQ